MYIAFCISGMVKGARILILALLLSWCVTFSKSLNIWPQSYTDSLYSC